MSDETNNGKKREPEKIHDVRPGRDLILLPGDSGKPIRVELVRRGGKRNRLAVRVVGCDVAYRIHAEAAAEIVAEATVKMPVE